MKRMILNGLCIGIFLFSCINVSAQKRIFTSQNIQTRDVAIDDFSSIEVQGIPRVIYSQTAGKQAKLQIVASDNLIDLVSCEVANGRLIVKMKEKVSVDFEKKACLDIITSGGHLESAMLSGSGDIKINGKLTTDALTLLLKGSGDIVTDIIECSEQILAEVNGSGDLTIDKVNAPTANITVKGSGDLVVGALKGNTASIEMNGSGDLTVKNSEVASSLSVKLVGAGDLIVNGIKTKSIQATLKGSGDIKLSGEADMASLEVQSSGDLSAKNLQAKDVNVTVSGSGDATCWVTQSLTNNISGSGTLGYRGFPKKMVTNGKREPRRL